MTRTQIPALNKLVGAKVMEGTLEDLQPEKLSGSAEPTKPINTVSTQSAVTTASAPPNSFPPTPATLDGSATRPPVPTGFPEFFLPMNLSFTKALSASGTGMPEEALMTGILYHPVIIASAQVRFLDRRYSLNTQQIRSALVTTLDKRGLVRWDDFSRALPDEKDMDPAPDPQARFTTLDASIADTRQMTALQKDFTDWAYRTSKITIRSNQAFGLFATPDVSQAEFMKACADAAREARDSDLAKATATLDRQIASLNEKIAKEERELQQDQTELGERKREELVSGAETVFSLLGGRRSRRISSTMSKHRMTEQSKADVDESIAAIDEFKKQLDQLEHARQQALDEAGSKWGEAVNNITEIPVLPKKSDVYVNLFGVAWQPFYQAKSAEQIVEIPAFQ
jgi:hypothetical protein